MCKIAQILVLSCISYAPFVPLKNDLNVFPKQLMVGNIYVRCDIDEGDDVFMTQMAQQLHFADRSSRYRRCVKHPSQLLNGDHISCLHILC